MPPLQADDVKLFGTTIGTALPALQPDNTVGAVSVSGRGEMYTQAMHGSKLQAAAAQGQHFMVANTTPGTGVAGIAAADGYDELETLFFIRNATTATTKIHLDFIQLQVTAAGTNGTTTNYTTGLDAGVTRFVSGGTSFTPKNCNTGSSVASGADRVQFGAIITLTATSDARLGCSWLPRVGVIKVVGDVYRWEFANPSPAITSMATAGTAIATNTFAHPPVVLGAGGSFLLHEYAASQTVGAAYQFTISWYER